MLADLPEPDIPANPAAGYPDLYFPSTATRLLGVGSTTLRRWAAENRIRQYAHPERSGYFYPVEDVSRELAGFYLRNGADTE